jgi:hypothetical protein
MATWKKVIVSGSNISQLNNDANYIADGDSGIVLSGSFSGSFQGDGSGLTGISADTLANSLLFGDGLAGGTFDGSSAITASVSASDTTLTVDANGVKVASSGITATQISESAVTTVKILDANVTNAKLENSSILVGGTSIELGATASTVDGLTLTTVVASGSFSGSFVGDGSGLSGIGGDLNVSGSDGSSGTVDLLTQDLTIDGTANEIETSVAGQTVTIGLPNDVTIGQDLTVTRNLTVQGTASFQHETNLDVADRFIRLASGSSAGGDGGIVIQQDSATNGEAFAFDNATTRWGVTGSFDASTNTIVPDAFMSAVVVGVDADPDNAPARYDAKGNIFVGTDEGIWIYS